ncbi:hypothetical protein BS17DRAFT_805937, partial [Gyrodon lividus]
MFLLPAGEVEGSSDSNPIRLDGIKKDDFKRLLEVLFMSNLRQVSYTYTSVNKSPVEKVVLAFQHDIKPWLLPGLNELAQRRDPITINGVELLCLHVALK